MPDDREYLVTVCGHCLKASCWQTRRGCHATRRHWFTTWRARQLDQLGREDRAHYAPQGGE